MTHSHEPGNDGSIKFGLVLNSLYTLIEFGFGIFTGSLALIADATHNLTDTFTLTVSFFANRLARRDANGQKTFGYGRATILAALLNATVMLGVAGFIVVEALKRFNQPTEVEGGIVALVALVGIAVNGSIAYVLSKRRSDLNMKSAFVDMAFDALSSLAAVIAGLVIMFTGIQYIDSIVALIIAALLLYNVVKILQEAVQILLEGTPKDIDIDKLSLAITDDDRVLEVDDLHIWTIRSGYNALSCHVIVKEISLPHSREIVEKIKARLRTNFNITHATIEVELEESVQRKTHESH